MPVLQELESITTVEERNSLALFFSRLAIWTISAEKIGSDSTTHQRAAVITDGLFLASDRIIGAEVFNKFEQVINND